MAERELSFSLSLLLLSFSRRWGKTTHKLDSSQQNFFHWIRAAWAGSQLLHSLTDLQEHVACMRVPARCIAHLEKVVVHEWGEQSSTTHQDHDDDKRHKKDLSKGNQSQDSVGLELNKGDEKSGTPPRVLAQSVKQCQTIAGKVNH
uniref:Uncharacterized protein n=1 Tax=Cacopsylla melanoneura TaxID=428564 RepID=A0A8D8M5V7_9HEMI